MAFFSCGLALLRNALSCVGLSCCCASQFPLVIVNQTMSVPVNCKQQLAMRSASERISSRKITAMPFALIAIGTEIGRRLLFAVTDHVSGESSFFSDQYARRMHMPPR
ncbi:hypothetical protein CSIM01_02070 [Colletotrichum simmondsii]|uniref:Secreted protein n=1 Tax=Colletotrichum simmondsii TaxID=703756 RepID=A0A135RZB2_9PEZI|nr:hypothetical protein CSIM01_02070 [Colletotrichum simmondsii]